MLARPVKVMLCAAVLLIGARVHAYGEFGPNVAGAEFPHTGLTLRIGSSGSADGYKLDFDMGATGKGTLVPRHLRRIYVRTGLEYVPGTWRVTLVDETVNTDLADFNVTLASNAWIPLDLPNGAWIDPAHVYRVHLIPQGNAEAEFHGLWGNPLPDVELGDSTLANTFPTRLRSLNMRYTNDAGTGPGAFLRTVAVFEMDDDTDPYALPSCGADASTLVSGNPYFDIYPVALDAGERISQTFGRVTQLPVAIGVSSPRVDIGRFDGSVVTYELSQSGVTQYDGDATNFGIFLELPPQPCAPFDVGDAGIWTLSFSPTDGTLELYVLSAGDGLGACDAPARATWGGAMSRASTGPSTDLHWSAWGDQARTWYMDRDHDTFGDPREPRLFCGYWDRPLDGGALDAGDCDDTRADIHPGVTEQCNGLDDDCDGVVDPQGAVHLDPCELTSGVCWGSLHSASQCVDGGWERCTADEYGPDYLATEPPACDGKDNDCDGMENTDAECPRQLGICAGAHINACQLSTDCTSDQYGPSFEDEEKSCDGLDNDCDGLMDGADPNVGIVACERNEGVCAHHAHSPSECGATGWSPCTAADYGSDFEATETRCDGLDNDCDGQVDEDCEVAQPSAPILPTRSCGCTSAGAMPLMALGLMLLARRRGSPKHQA